MKIVATQAFVEQARTRGVALRGRLDEAVRAVAQPGVPWAHRLDDRNVLGLTVDEGQLAFWFLEREDGAPRQTPPLADVSRLELLDLGAPAECLEPLQRARSLVELEWLSMPEAARARVRFLFVQKSRGLALAPIDLSRAATGPRQLEELLCGQLTDLLLNLDVDQRRIVELGGHGPIVVKGVAGSGKTAVAIHRVVHLLSQRSLFGPPRILYLTYNRSLASAALELLGAVGVRAGEAEVTNFHRWCLRASKLARGVVLTHEREQLRLLRQARDTVAGRSGRSTVFSYGELFWQEELHRVRGRVVGGEAEYLSMERQGAGKALSPELRKLVWQVVEEYERLCEAHEQLDFDGLVRVAWRRLELLGKDAPRYDSVLVDEGQDLTPLAYRIASRLCGPNGDLFVVYDPAQSIYERAFRWKDCGIEVHGARSFALTRNYRNTKEILDSVLPLLGAMRREPAEAEGAEAALEPQAQARHGARPSKVQVPMRQIYSTLTTLVRRRIEEDGIPPQNIAVLALRTRTVRAAFDALTEAGILCRRYSKDSELRLADPSVKVGTMHSAKGLEWPVVYIVAPKGELLASGGPHAPEARAAHVARMRRLAYMAMTRAIADLVILSGL